MDLIVQWVTQIIILILLAVIVDLLIPANTLKKYIKFVVGLILILIFLKPVFYLFSIDLEHTFERSLDNIFYIQEEDSLENSIEIQKSEIVSTQHAYIVEQMAVPLIDIAKTPLMKEHDVEITDIDFTFYNEQIDSYENLEEVIVTIREYEKGEGAIQEVDDIVINMKDSSDTREDVDTESIKEFLQEIWDLHDKTLSIKWEGGHLD